MEEGRTEGGRPALGLGGEIVLGRHLPRIHENDEHAVGS